MARKITPYPMLAKEVEMHLLYGRRGDGVGVSEKNQLNATERIKRRREAERVHVSLQPVLAFAQCISLLPIYGVFSQSPCQLRYISTSFRTMYSVIVILSTLLLTSLTFYQLGEEGVNYRIIGEIVFYLAGTMSMIAFFKLATEWQCIMMRWASVEEFMIEMTQVRVRRFILFLSLYFSTSSLAEHFLSIIAKRGIGHAEEYYKSAFRQVFSMTEFTLWKGIILTWLNTVITLTWNFTDLFLMTVSIALSSKFSQLNCELDQVLRKNVSLVFWKRIRETYSKLSELTKYLDEKLSFFIILSFGNNLYFICYQLLQSLNPTGTTNEIYFSISFIHLLTRTCAVCLSAASVFDNSRRPLTILFSVPSESYNVEVQRLISQISFDKVALTGYQFFSVTRTLMLTIAGTVVTYEIVLVQFGTLNPSNETITR